jgi:hypothetical protein
VMELLLRVNPITRLRILPQDAPASQLEAATATI